MAWMADDLVTVRPPVVVCASSRPFVPLLFYVLPPSRSYKFYWKRTERGREEEGYPSDDESARSNSSSVSVNLSVRYPLHPLVPLSPLRWQEREGRWAGDRCLLSSFVQNSALCFSDVGFLLRHKGLLLLFTSLHYISKLPNSLFTATLFSVSYT